MDRRELLKMIAGITGMAFVGGDLWAKGEAQSSSFTLFNTTELQLLDEIAETIIPATDTPGAKAAGCGSAMALFISDCYTPDQQQVIKHGLVQIQALAQQQFQKSFSLLNNAQRQQLLAELDQKSRLSTTQQQQPAQVLNKEQYFILLKQLTIFTFFTSKIGATQVREYVAVPGRYDGNATYKKKFK